MILKPTFLPVLLVFLKVDIKLKFNMAAILNFFSFMSTLWKTSKTGRNVGFTF